MRSCRPRVVRLRLTASTGQVPRRGSRAWGYLGAAYGARAQWRVLRLERLPAARDGKRIKESLERALELVRALQVRYPRNPLFHQIEAKILDGYLHDPAASLRASERLLALAQSGAVNRTALAETVARLNMARQLRALTRTTAANFQLDAIIAARPAAPAGALTRAERMRRELKTPASSTRIYRSDREEPTREREP